jgi:cytochrome b561
MAASMSVSRFEPPPRYAPFAVALHWIVAALVLLQVTWGWLMQEVPKVPAGLRADTFNVHKSTGLVLLALMLFRLGWRLRHPPPSLDGLPRWQRTAARVNHLLLYAVLLLMPIAGYLGSEWSGYPVKWFGLTLPSWSGPHPALKDAMSDVHLALGVVLVVAVAVHVTAVLLHARAGDEVATRMRFTRRPPTFSAGAVQEEKLASRW